MADKELPPLPFTMKPKEKELPPLPFSNTPQFQPEMTPIEKVASATHGLANTLTAGVHGAANFLTAGHLPQLEAMLENAPKVPGALFNHAIGDDKKASKIFDSYISDRDRIIQQEKDLRAMGHGGYGAGELAGTALLPEGEAIKGAGYLSKLGKYIKTGALFGGAFNPGDTPGKISGIQPLERVKNAEKMAALSGLFGGASQAAGPGIKRMMTPILGPSQDAINSYLANSERINSARTEGELHAAINATVNDIYNSVDTGKMGIGDAKAKIAQLKDQVARVTEAAGGQFETKKNTAMDAVQNATDTLESITQQAEGAHAAKTPELEQKVKDAQAALDSAVEARNAPNASIQHPRAMRDEVTASVGDLRSQVENLSKQSRNIAAQNTIQTKPMSDALLAEINKMMPGGQAPLTAEMQATLDKVQALKDRIDKLPPTIQGDVAKSMMQELDKVTSFAESAGSFDADMYNRAKRAVRSSIDGQVKTDPNYKTLMEQVSQKTQDLIAADKLFGTDKAAQSTLANIHKPDNLYKLETLDALGNHVGEDYGKRARDYGAEQERLSQKVDPTTLPEHAELQKAQADLDTHKSEDWQTQHVQEAVNNSDIFSVLGPRQAEVEKMSMPGAEEQHLQTQLEKRNLPGQLSEANADLEQKLLEQQKSEDLANGFSRLGDNSTESQMKRVRNGGDSTQFTTRKAFAKIDPLMSNRPKQYGDVPINLDESKGPITSPLLQEIDDRGVLNEFQGQDTNGSRKTVMGTVLGSGISGVGAATLPHSPLITAAEAALPAITAGTGFVLDKYGPQTSKALLDHYIRNQGAYKAFTNIPPEKYLAPWLLMGGDRQP